MTEGKGLDKGGQDISHPTWLDKGGKDFPITIQFPMLDLRSEMSC